MYTELALIVDENNCHGYTLWRTGFRFHCWGFCSGHKASMQKFILTAKDLERINDIDVLRKTSAKVLSGFSNIFPQKFIFLSTDYLMITIDKCQRLLPLPRDATLVFLHRQFWTIV